MYETRPKLMNGHFQCQDKLDSVFYLQAMATWTFAGNKEQNIITCKFTLNLPLLLLYLLYVV